MRCGTSSRTYPPQPPVSFFLSGSAFVAGDDFATGAKENFNSISCCGGWVMATGAGATTTVAVSINRSTISKQASSGWLIGGLERGTLLILVLVMRLGILVECRVYIAGGGGACCVCGERVQDKTEESSRTGVEVEVESESESAWVEPSDRRILTSSYPVVVLYFFF